MYTVYALIDPRDWSVHYVGMTDSVYTRFQQHIKLQSNNEEKNAWLQSLKDADVMVFMKTLETTENLETARQREVYWIQHYSQLNTPLTNRYLPAPIMVKHQVSHESTRVVVKKDLTTRVAEYRSKHPEKKLSQIAQHFGVSVRTIQRRLSVTV